MDTKTYAPSNIEDSKYPGEKDQKDYSTTQKTSYGVYKPIVIEDNPFPYKKVANEIHGSKYNTIAGQTYY